jgi:hypothetical protein
MWRFALKIEQVFELPSDVSESMTLRSPRKSDAACPPVSVEIGKVSPITLQPFEVLTLESQAARPLGR